MDEYVTTFGMGHALGKVKRKYVEFLENLFRQYDEGRFTRTEMILRLAKWCEEQTLNE